LDASSDASSDANASSDSSVAAPPTAVPRGRTKPAVAASDTSNSSAGNDSSSDEEAILQSDDSGSDENYTTTHDHRIDPDKVPYASKRSRGRPRKSSTSDSTSLDANEKLAKQKPGTITAKVTAAKTATKKTDSPTAMPSQITPFATRESRLMAADPAIAEVIMKTNNLFELVTTQCNAIRIMIDAIREFTFGFYLVCDENGVYFEDASTTHKLAIRGVLYGNEFSHYQCITKGKPLRIGISIPQFYANIRSLTSPKNIMGIFINEKNPSCFNMVFMNKVRNQLMVNSIPLGDFPENPISNGLDLKNYKCIFTYPSTFFREIFRNMSTGQFEYIEFTVYDNELSLSCISDSSKRSVSTTIKAIMNSDNTTVTEDSPLKFTNSINKDKIYRGVFNMKRIVQFTRCTQNCQSVKIYLENDMPLAIQYDVSNHGTITLFLDPITL
jgi:hypothetical protein